jgi:PBP1b-binding outer membrane lipoprotein LpoB
MTHMNPRTTYSIKLPIVIALFFSFLVGCGSKKATRESATSSPQNPIEQINRDANLTDQQKREAIEKLMRNSASATVSKTPP